MKGITYCGACADYDIKKHRCKRGAQLESNPQDKFFDDCPLPDAVPVVRCKDCTHRTEMGNCGHPRHHGILPTAYPYDFCSYGARMDGDSDAKAD